MTAVVITLFERQTISCQSIGLTRADPILENLDRISQSTGKELIRL